MEVGRRGIEAELDAKLVATLQPRAQVVLNVDLDGPLAQAPEELRAHAPIGDVLAHQAGREVDLRVGG